jgi:chemotaxis protein methyltransferase CheR
VAKPVIAAPSESVREGAVADLELSLLLEAILRSSGHDFTDYSQGLLKRRIAERIRAEGVRTISGLQERILHDPAALASFLFSMANRHGSLFEDPAFFRVFRARILPLLRTYSFRRIWVPGCASGEDAYSIAVVMHEEGLLDRTMIYATEGSELAVAAARAGVFELDSPEEVRTAYGAAGSARPLEEVCDVTERAVSFRDELKRHIIFAKHSLVTDGSLNEFHVIVARGVLRQFNRSLQFRVHNLFLNSLIRLGFLCLDATENLRFTPHEGVFRKFDDAAPIYRRMR